MKLTTGSVSLAAVDSLLQSQLVNLLYLESVLQEPVMYPEEFLDLYRMMSEHDRRIVLPVFDGQYYLTCYPDIASSGADPLPHFLTTGITELRSPHPLIDPRFITERRPDLFRGGMNLSELIGVVERNVVDPSPYFSISDYQSARVGELEEQPSLLMHFLTKGSAEGAWPNDFLDPEYYASSYDDVPGRGLEAVLHFIQIGDRLARRPSLKFDPAWYRAQYPDASVASPLQYFLAIGRAQKHQPKARSDGDEGAPLEWLRPVGVPRETEQEVLQRYDAFVKKTEAVDRERRAGFKTWEACPVKLDDAEQELTRLGFYSSALPRVDILIPACNEFHYTVECLASVQRSAISIPYQVIVADDASSDPRMAKLAEIPGLVHLVANENRGFLRNANWAFAKVTAEYVLLLNNDAQLMPGCVDHLVQILDEDPSAAAAAPMILYPNGRLQEAGCAVRFDGSSVMVGVGEDPDEACFNYRRRVQYASGACLLLRRAALDGILFDECYAPAYCEDMDLCTRLRATGLSIVYEPAARAVHHLSVSILPTARARRIRLIMRNQAKYIDRWGDMLDDDTRVRVLAFYLPQFHPVAQNDLWWGKGFTEWTNVARALPAFRGHYQPHLPADLGFYDLRVTRVLGEQQKLARRYGIEGFVVYYYNFGGRRILETPMDLLLADKSVDFRFALCWANENWTQHWDGGSRSILLEQTYDAATIASVADDAIRFARDPRAIRVCGKPLFVIYRPMLLPDVEAVANLLRRRFTEAGFAGLHLVYVESMELISQKVVPSEIGFDAAIEFPPQGIGQLHSGPVQVIREDFDGKVYDYERTVLTAVSRAGAGYVRHPTVFATWDNTPRQPRTGTVLQGAAPELFQAYVERKLDEVENFSIADERLLFVNAWNEWAEGAHLEPDQTYGHRWLATLRNALVYRGMFQ